MNNLKILIIEDESLVALELSSTISALGYNVVEYATNIKTAVQLMNEYEVNLILMDINLNDTMDGIELYKSFNTKISLIYLTAYKDEITLSRAIETEPLGYLIKPHDEYELKALLKLASYKMQNNTFKSVQNQELLKIGNGYVFNKKENKLFFNDIFISLSSKELQLLKLLINARGNVVTFQTIEDEIWSEKIVSASALRTLIYRLRGKFEYKLIQSEFNFGIKLQPE
ncbi:DNA-binding response regulator [bacterium]|nr:DNA-binding response regulator [bacterium]MBU1994035.1 DNA-binding response regulator [bacterium]